MTGKMIRTGVWLLAGILCLTACTEDYDPIGNNKPATKLKMSPQYIAFDGAGGEQQATIETNAPDLTVGNLPDWIDAVSFNEDKTAVTVKAAANTSDQVRTGIVPVSTVTGDTESTLFLKVVQAGQGARIAFESFAGTAAEPGRWMATDETKITQGKENLIIEGAPNGIGNSYYFQNPEGLVAQAGSGAGNVVTAYVDVKASPGMEGGLKAYYNPKTGDEFQFFFSINAENTGSFFALRQINGTVVPMALGDAIPGPGMPALPPLGERDEYIRIEFTNVPYLPNWWQSEVNIYSLQTRNGETKVLDKHFSRKFEIDGPKPTPGYFGLWGRFGSVPFRHFTLSAKE